MRDFYRQFFTSHPDPMWIYDLETLQFLDVNTAAIAAYGYSLAEFMAMTIKDIRPPEDIVRLADNLATAPVGLEQPGVWRHRTKSGDIFDVEIRSHTFDYDGRPSRVVTARNMSAIVAAQEETFRLNAMLHQTLNNISDAFYTLDRDWKITFFNREASRLMNRDPVRFVGKNLWDDFPEAVGTTFDTEFRRAVATGEAASFVEYFAPFEKWFEVKAYPSDDGLAVYFRDVTQARAQQAQLHMLEAAVARLNDIVLITEAEPFDEPGPRIVYVNDAFERRTGWSREEVIGRTPRMLQGPATDRGTLDHIRAALDSWTPVRAELINYTKSGEPFWLELDIVPLADATGWFTHWVAVERDITERKTASLALAVSEERFRIVARATSDVVWDWDLDADTVWWNEGMRTIFGHDELAMSASPLEWSSRIHPDDIDRVLNSIGACIEGDGTTWAEAYRFARADGSIAEVSDRAFVIRDAGGQALRMVGSMADMTERKKLESQLRQAQRLEAVGQLTGGIAHDFNNLLTVILGNAEILTERLAEDSKLRLLASMTQTAAERGAQLTNRLLAFARRQALDPKSTDINRLIAGMDGLLQRSLGRHIDIELVRGGGLWEAIVDPPQLENAILNLCINARDSMQDGGKLTVETANAHLDQAYADLHQDVTAGQYVMVAVSDTGTGMSAETMVKAFEPFFTTKSVGRGSGLGLSMVYGFVKQSNGHVKIYSEIGQGTTIRMYLPRAGRDAEKAAATQATVKAAGGSERILMVEDDDLVRSYAAGQLRDLGYVVTEVSTAAEALVILSDGSHVDLLFTDVVMPGGMGGRQLAEQARLKRPGLPVLFTSGYTENAIVHHGRLDAGVHLLQKPYHRIDLATKIRAVLKESGLPGRKES